jgi:tetratricopeptide (TPR) repeat protein/predicted Ser/Thr protein kinase
MIGETFGHYRVLGRIGAGGMGEVYRAYDLHLERDVALKILPAGFLADDAARKRFRREALALSKLNHPNVATIFDFDSQDGVDFLAMELIHGTPLSERVDAGVSPDREVLRLGIQLAEGLMAAHTQGVIHRDLKPSNLMVTADGRLKILDFGVAVSVLPLGDSDPTRSITETTNVAGTLPYMAPEQLRGQLADARSDIYSAGVVLYELATGRRPFPQSQSAELIGAILHQPPSSTSHGMPPGLERIVMKSLDKEPAERYQSARELLTALEAVNAGAAPAAKRIDRRVVAIGTLVIFLLAALPMGLNIGGLRDRVSRLAIGRADPAGPPLTRLRTRRSVAVLGFKNLSGRQEKAWISTALSEMLTTELAAGEQLRTIPGENVAQMKNDLSLPDSDSYGRDTLTKIRSNLGTDHIVLGSYVPLGDEQIRLDLRLQDTAAGETLAAISERGSEAQIDDLVSRAGSALRQRLGVGELSATDTVAVRATLPSNPAAVRHYTEGLAKLRAFDVVTARDLLQRAIAADPDSSLPRAALAAAWSSLGYDERANAEAKRAFELSATLSREERLAVEGRYRATTREWEKSIEIYRTLWNFFPDNLDYGLQLANVQISAGKGSEALTTIAAIRQLPAPMSTDPRVDLAEASAAGSLSDFRRQGVAAQAAAAKASGRGMRLLAARAQQTAGRAFFQVGEHEQALRSYEQAREIYAATGDRAGFARVSVGIGNVFTQRAEYAESEKFYQEALSIQRDIGDQGGLAASLTALFVDRYWQKDLPAAKRFIQDALTIGREINDRSRIAVTLNNLGIVLYLQEDPGGARKVHEEALAIRREIGDKQGVAMSLNNLAELLAAQPDLPAAKRTLEEALAIARETDDRSRAAYALNAIGGVIYRQGDLAEARRKLEQALTIRNELGERGRSADTRTTLAAVILDEGDAARAETLAREAAEEFSKEHANVSEASARTALAKSLLVQGKLAEAVKALDTATRMLASTDDRGVRLTLLITDARVRAASGQTADATKSLEAVLAEAAKYHRVADELEARLALGEIEMASGKAVTGRARLAVLEKDATATGYVLIARKADAAANRR